MLKRIITQVRYWKYLGWTMPFAALGGISFFWLFGKDTYLDIFFVIVCSVFFTISVFWWWWALDKIVIMIKASFDLKNRFNDVLDEIKKLRKELKE